MGRPEISENQPYSRHQPADLLLEKQKQPAEEAKRSKPLRSQGERIPFAQLTTQKQPKLTGKTKKIRKKASERAYGTGEEGIKGGPGTGVKNWLIWERGQDYGGQKRKAMKKNTDKKKRGRKEYLPCAGKELDRRSDSGGNWGITRLTSGPTVGVHSMYNSTQRKIRT